MMYKCIPIWLHKVITFTYYSAENLSSKDICHMFTLRGIEDACDVM